MTSNRLARRDTLVPGWLGRRVEELWPERLADLTGSGTVKIEEFLEDDTLVVRAELPGIDPDKDVSLSVQDGMLHIHGERTEHSEDRKKDHFRSEFFYGYYDRAVRLPEGTTATDIKATYKDGVLEVRVPVPEGAQRTGTVPVIRLP